MKKLFILAAVITTSLIATKGYSQVYVGARVGLRIPAPRVYVAPPVVYASGYYAAPAICEADFPAMLIMTIRPGTVTTGIVSTSNTTVLSSKETTGLISTTVASTMRGSHMTAASTEAGGKPVR